MVVEVGDPLFGVESHRLFKVGSLLPSLSAVGEGQAPDCAPAAVPKHRAHDNQSRSSSPLRIAPVRRPRSAQPIDPKVKARIDRILKATPLIDGHNDIAEQLAENYKRNIEGLASGTDQRQPHR